MNFLGDNLIAVIATVVVVLAVGIYFYKQASDETGETAADETDETAADKTDETNAAEDPKKPKEESKQKSEQNKTENDGKTEEVTPKKQ